MSYTEKDIENLFIDWYLDKNTVLVGHQVRVPTGIIDLLFYNKPFGCPIVVEVKKGKAPKTTLAQLYGYVWYIKDRINNLFGNRPFHDNLPAISFAGRTIGIILAEDVDEKTWRALTYSHEIRFIKYSVSGSKVRFYRPWEYDDYFKPTMGEDPIIDKMIRMSDDVVKATQLSSEHRLANNVGGIYDPILFDDLSATDNVIWKRNEK